MNMSKVEDVIDEKKINNLLEQNQNPSSERITEVINKAMLLKGLELDDVSALLSVNDKETMNRIFEASSKIKEKIYGERLVLFAPIYVSNYCVNDCKYCGFHRSNNIERKKLTIEEVKEQVRILEDMGHKRLLLEFGEDSQNNPIDYVIEVIKAIYDTKSKKGEIRRLNVNIAATSVEDYKKLKEAGIGTYQLFQETYHRPTYESMHDGPKADYERQLFAHDRAFQAGIDDIGLGVLFGLFNYKFEVMALVSHANYLEKKFGVGPHTFSVPRWQKAGSVEWEKAPHCVSEDELLKIIAILRLAVPYTGMIISTRESPETRARAFEIGISQTSAASRTSPGGYGMEGELTQFSLSDHRSLDKVMESVLRQDILPSFCTACYRLGRTGKDFMDIAKPGEIHFFCRPNAILTFKEYLIDYATEKVKVQGERVIEKYLKQIKDPKRAEETRNRLILIENGERDLYF